MSTDYNTLPDVDILNDGDNLLAAASIVGGGYALSKLSSTAIANLLDTQGYGTLFDIQSYQGTGKITQALDNAREVSKGKLTTPKAIINSMWKNIPLEITAMESSIETLRKELNNPNLTKLQVEKIKEEIIGRSNNLIKRKGLATNVARSLGREVNFTIPSDFTPKNIKINNLISRIEPKSGLKPGQTALAMQHTGEEMKEFRRIAQQDQRVQYISKLMKEGNIKEARRAAKGSHFMKGGSVIVPEKVKGMPVNLQGEGAGMKFFKLPGERVLEGKKVPVYRLQFSPKRPMGYLNPARQYVTGQHFQYIDYYKTPFGYQKVKGKMLDIHNLAPGSNKILAKAEGLFAKPVVNYADIDYKIQRKERKPITDRPKKLGKYKKKIFSASKTPYSQKTPNFRKNILKAVGKGAVAIATKFKIR